MSQSRRSIQTRIGIAFTAILLATSLASAEGELKTINPPGGGMITYGQVEGETTEAGAMGSILRNLHKNLGDRPKVGKLFDVKGTNSVAVFFTVTRKNQAGPQAGGQAGAQIAGMIIAAKASTEHVEAAVLTDDAARFSKTINPMTRELFKVWHPLESARTTGGQSNSPAAPLHKEMAQDGSAALGLPQGWNVAAKMSGGGTMVALGPNGESAEMGIAWLAADPRYPAVQQTMQSLQHGGLQGTVYAKATYMRVDTEMTKSFETQIQKTRSMAHLPPAEYRFAKVTSVGESAQEKCSHFEGTVDFKDGKGAREMNTLYCVFAPGKNGTWGSNAYMTSVPMALAAKERATLAAIMQSFQVDMGIVGREANQIAKPEVDKIHEIGRQAADQARSAHQAEDIQRSSVYAHWDSIDKRSQEFENYQLNYAVISTTDHTAHGTFDADEAALLVQQNPDKLEYVSAPNYWKGIDY